jgi:dipeptidyl-peptidase-4
MHIYLYHLDGTFERQVTKGPWEVTQIADVNETRGLIYFMSTQVSPLERHLYSIRFDGSGMKRVSREAGWHSPVFSPDHLVYIDSYSSAASPTNISLRTNDGSEVAQLVENTMEKFKGYRFGEQKFFTFKTTDGETLNGWMIKPQDFSSATRYPVLM